MKPLYGNSYAAMWCAVVYLLSLLSCLCYVGDFQWLEALTMVPGGSKTYSTVVGSLFCKTNKSK